jgi:hypothetical protein
LRFIGTGWGAAFEDPIFVLSIFPFIEIHVVRVVVHGVVLSWVEGSIKDAESIFVG